MSSHHIVKEDQEPALIIEDIGGVNVSVLHQLLEWNPTVVANSENAERIVTLGIKIDVLITDGAVDLPQDHIITLPLVCSFLDTALSHLIAKGWKAVNILSNRSNPELLLHYHDEINANLLGNGRRMFAIKSGFTKWKPAGEPIYVYGGVRRTSGLMPQGEGRYVTEKDGFFSVYFPFEYGLLGENL